MRTLICSAQAADQMSKHAERGVACTTCHKGDFKAPSTDVCTGCHSRDALAKATESMNFEAVLKNPKTGKETRHTALINVHDSYHFGRTENCFDCHREHKPSTNQCATCHDIEAWKMPTPK